MTRLALGGEVRLLGRERIGVAALAGLRQQLAERDGAQADAALLEEPAAGDCCGASR